MEIHPYLTFFTGAILVLVSIFFLRPGGNFIDSAVPVVVGKAVHFLGMVLLIVGAAGLVKKLFDKIRK